MLCALFGVRLGAACVAIRSVAERSCLYKYNEQLVATRHSNILLTNEKKQRN